MPKRSGFVPVLLAIGVVACVASAGHWWLGPNHAEFYTDDGTIRAEPGQASLRDILWRPPTGLGESINSPGDEGDPEITAAGDAVYFTRFSAAGDADLYIARRDGSGWGEPEPLPINTPDNEFGAALSPDGAWLYFASDRPGSIGGVDLWRSSLREGAFGTPEPLGPSVNTPNDDISPTLSTTEATDPGSGAVSPRTVLYFSSDRPTAEAGQGNAASGFDLYRSTDGRPAVRDDTLSSPADDLSPAFSPAGDFLYFSSARDGGAGGFDLYRARLSSAVPLTPVPLDRSINTVADELEPSLAMEGFALQFASDRGGDHTDLYRAVSREVYLATDSRRAMVADLLKLLPWILAALALVLLLALLTRSVRDISWQGRLATLSLMARCVLLSMLIHGGIMAVLAVMHVPPTTGTLAADDGTVRVTLASSGMRRSIEAQLRPGHAAVELSHEEPSVPSPSASPSEREPLPDALLAPTVRASAPDRLERFAPERRSESRSEPLADRSNEAFDAPPIPEQSSDTAELQSLSVPAPRSPSSHVEPLQSARASQIDTAPPASAVAVPTRSSDRFEPDGSLQSAEPTDLVEPPLMTARNGSRHAADSPRATPDLPDESIASEPALTFTLPGVSHAAPVREQSEQESMARAARQSRDLSSTDVSMKLDRTPGARTELDPTASAPDTAPSDPRDRIEIARPSSGDRTTEPRRTTDFALDLPDLVDAVGPVSPPTPRAEGEPGKPASDTTTTGTQPNRSPIAELAVPSAPAGRSAISEIEPGEITERSVDALEPAARKVEASAARNGDAAGVLFGLDLPVFADPPSPDLALPSATRMLTGEVVDRESGETIAGASVRLDHEKSADVRVFTDDLGRFVLPFGEIPENAALTASHSGYTPHAVNIVESDSARREPVRIELSPINADIIAFEEEPEVHHLGNDEFSGRINSQFQRRTEGTRLAMRFTIPPERHTAGFSAAEFRLVTKGSQLENRVFLNGDRIGVLAESPGDGSFGEQAILAPIDRLQPGENVLEIRAVKRRDTDIDDFEFVNVRLVFDPKNAAEDRTPSIRGVALDASSDEPINGARVTLDLHGRMPIVALTDENGRFRLKADAMPEHAAIIATHPSYEPFAVGVDRRDVLDAEALVLRLREDTRLEIAAEATPTVRHLGDDAFGSAINSRFQRASEGLEITLDFTIDPSLLRVAHQAELVMLAKGLETNPPIGLNGQEVGRLAHSPGDGRFAEQRVVVPVELLRGGLNSVTLRSVRERSDHDDFEVVNVGLRIVPKLRSVY